MVEALLWEGNCGSGVVGCPQSCPCPGRKSSVPARMDSLSIHRAASRGLGLQGPESYLWGQPASWAPRPLPHHPLCSPTTAHYGTSPIPDLPCPTCPS